MTHHHANDVPTVGEIGEQGILDAILPILHSKHAGLGPGDDAGALKVLNGEVIVSVDTLVEGQDFRKTWESGFEHRAYDLGWKSIAQNVSDINAMGGAPTGAVVSLSIPEHLTVEWVKDFANGISGAIKGLEATNLAILGGDLGKSSEISVTTTVLGECQNGKILRSGAKAGDRIAIAGRLGAAGAGLAVLQSNKKWQTWSRSVHRFVDAQCKPVPPLSSGPRAAASGASAMMDISDGLLRDASRLAKASRVNVNFDSHVLQTFADRLEPAARLLGEDSMRWVLEGGEDFGLLATFPKESSIPEEFTVIGTVSPQNGRRAQVKIDGKTMGSATGFDHFSA